MHVQKKIFKEITIMILASVDTLVSHGVRTQHEGNCVMIDGTGHLTSPKFISYADSARISCTGEVLQGSLSLVLMGGKGGAYHVIREDMLANSFSLEYEVDLPSLAVYEGADELYLCLKIDGKACIKALAACETDAQKTDGESIDNTEKAYPVPNKMLFIGNSLVFGMDMSYGMCSTSPESDYFHHVTAYVRSKNPRMVAEKLYGSMLERTASPAAYYNWLYVDNNHYTHRPAIKSFTEDIELITVQLGDNINTEQFWQNFAIMGDDFIETVKKKCPRARIIWIHGWYNRQPVYDMIARLCRRHGIERIFIGDLRSRENECHEAREYLGRDGLQKSIRDTWRTHPGDLGMRRIADRIIEKLGF